MVKRIVFQHTQGPYPGLTQILGLVTELEPEEAAPPPSIEGFEALDRMVEFASLVQVKGLYVLYREVVKEVAK